MSWMKQGPNEFTEVAGLVTLDENTLGYKPDGSHATHAIQVTGLAGGSVTFAVRGPAGTFANVAAGVTENEIVSIGPRGVIVSGAGVVGPGGRWAAIRMTFVGTAGAGKAHVQSTPAGMEG